MWWPMARRSRPLSLSLIDCRVSRIWGEKWLGLLKRAEWTQTEMFDNNYDIYTEHDIFIVTTITDFMC